MPNNAFHPLVKGLVALYGNNVVEKPEWTTEPDVLAIFFSCESLRDKSAVSRFLNKSQLAIKKKFAKQHDIREGAGIDATMAALDAICGLNNDFGTDDGHNLLGGNCTALSSICYSGEIKIADAMESCIANRIREYFEGQYINNQPAVKVYDQEVSFLLESLRNLENRAATIDGIALIDPSEARWRVLRYLCACGISGVEALGSQEEEMERYRAIKRTSNVVGEVVNRVEAVRTSVHLQRMEVEDGSGLASVVEDYAFRFDCRQITIGTLSDNDVRIDGFLCPCISRRHAVLEKEGNEWFLTHKSSTNASAIVDSKGNMKVLVMPGCRVRVDYGSMILLAPVYCKRPNGKGWAANYEKGAVLRFDVM